MFRAGKAWQGKVVVRVPDDRSEHGICADKRRLFHLRPATSHFCQKEKSPAHAGLSSVLLAYFWFELGAEFTPNEARESNKASSQKSQGAGFRSNERVAASAPARSAE